MERRTGAAIRGSLPHAFELMRALAATALACATVTAPSAVAAAGNSLSNGSASPSSGTTDTIFQFSVSYSSPQGFAATSVVVRVANRAIEMVLVAGTDVDGVYQATSQLPEGSWPVMFDAIATQGRSPTLAGPTVVVANVPAATSPPAPAPVPVVPGPPPPPPVTPVPPPVASAAAVGSPIVDPAAGATPAGAQASGASAPGVMVGTPGGETVPAVLIDDGAPWTQVVAAIVAAIVVLALGAFAVALRRRAAETQRQPERAVIASSPSSAPAPSPRKLADWELSALDDEPIGTVEYLGRQP